MMLLRDQILVPHLKVRDSLMNLRLQESVRRARRKLSREVAEKMRSYISGCE